VKLFIGWSGDKSKRLARELQVWIPDVIQAVDAWMSEVDIMAGANWNQELENALRASKFAIICLTKENVNAPWIHFEAGFLNGSKTPVCPYLIDLDSSQVKGPLIKLQCKKADLEGTLSLLSAIKKTAGNQTRIKEGQLKKQFDIYWPGLNDKIEELKRESESTPSEPSESPALESAIEFIGSLRATQRKPEEEPKKKEAAMLKLRVMNPSNKGRKGTVTIPWQSIYEKTPISQEEVVVRDKALNLLPTQVDIVDPADPSSAILLFSLNNEIQGQQEDNSAPPYLVTLEKGNPLKQPGDAPRVEVVKEKGKERRVKLINNRLEVWLELFPAPWDREKSRNWYAGAASSVSLDGREILSAFRIDLFDYEKRCIQIDRLFYPGGKTISINPGLINQPYRLISQSSGPVRASVTIASSVFNYNYTDANTEKHISCKCQLYRIINLYKDANYLVEEISLREVPADGKISKPYMHLPFEARYFSYVDFGLDRYRLNYRPEWLVMGSEWFPYPGYGFATNTDVRSFENPHLEFPDPVQQHKTFSWILRCKEKTMCLHLFTYGESDELRGQVDRAWYEFIYEPLTAKVT
jgi:hypothetical protein